MKFNSDKQDKRFAGNVVHTLRFIIIYWVLWIVLFEIARLIFLFSNYAEWKQAGIVTGLKSLRYGLRMDLSFVSYLIFPLIILLIIGVLFPILRKAVIYKLYTAITVVPIVLLIFADIGLYKAWGSRIDATVLKYFSNPKEMWASVSHLPIFWIGIAYLLLVIVIICIFNFFINWQFKSLENIKGKLITVFCLLILGCLFIIPLRGGLQLAPINQSSVYFSPSNFANLAALNAPWNFMYSVNHHVESGSNPFNFIEATLSKKITDSLFTAEGKTNYVLDEKIDKPNIILIIWESFTAKVIDSTLEGKEITPGFNQLKNEGIYFSGIYASGDRTDKGIVAVLSGYPSQPTTSIVKIPSKAAKLPALGKLLKAKGYENTFYYGGELEFANLKAYLFQSGYEHFISINDFEKKEQNSKWGAHDGVVSNRMSMDIEKMKQPFFCTWMTLSSHEPFETPVAPSFQGSDDKSLFLNSLHYTDSCVAAFISHAKMQPWWSNTIVIIVADHGHRLPRSGNKENDFKIPLLMLGGAVKQHLNFTKVGGQTDLPATIWGQVGAGNVSPFRWSKNLLDSSTKHWAYFSFNNGFGFVEDSSMFIYDNVGRRMIESRGRVDSFQVRKGKTFLQNSFQDYLDK